MHKNTEPGAGNAGFIGTLSGAGKSPEPTACPASPQELDPAALPPAAAEFDYSALDSDTAAYAQQAAGQIKANHQQTIELIVATGVSLNAVKKKLGHGHFSQWLAAEFRWTDRTARNYMAAAEHFHGRAEIISDLQPATVYALAAPASASVREEIEARHRSGEQITDADIKEKIGEARFAARMAKADAKLTNKQKKDRERRARNSSKRAREEREAAQRERQQQEERVKLKAVAAAEILIRKLSPPDLKQVAEALDEWGALHVVRERLNAALVAQGLAGGTAVQRAADRAEARAAGGVPR